MANKLLDGRHSKVVGKRHGKNGFVQVNVSVPPMMKTILVKKARANKRSLNAEVRIAIAKHVEVKGELPPK